MKKINQLIYGWIKGTVGLTNYLAIKGFQKDLLRKYVGSNWLESLGYGAYKLANDNIEWYGALYTLQTQKGFMIHPGGKTALELKGYAHYLKPGSSMKELFANKNDILPKWFMTQKWMKDIQFISTNLFDYRQIKTFTTYSFSNIEIKISTPELAIMEMLFNVPNKHSFEEADLIMESLATLRSGTIQELLENCNSIKVKRIFLYLAEKNNHYWLNALNIKKINLGRGKRMVVRNGVLNKKYEITVPRNYER